jgi:hypothetical protein
MPPTHGASHKNICQGTQPDSPYVRLMVALPHPNKGGMNVDLALRLNVLAMCAAFVFVGAVVLGAF